MTNKKVKRAIEFALLCIAFPGFIIFNNLGSWMFLFLWSATAYCILIDRLTIFTNWKDLWGWDAVNFKNLILMLIRFGICVILMIAFTAWYAPDRLFYLPQNEPSLVWRIMIFYPLLSALPQEYIFCRFFFARYKIFFGDKYLMIIMSAIVFAFAHVLFINPVAPTLGFIAGIIFAHTYWKTKSLALVTIEHGLYGNALFLIGLGAYFYSGAIT